MLNLQYEVLAHNDQIGVPAISVLRCNSIRSVIGPGRTPLAMLFEPSNTGAALFAAVDHRAYCNEVAGLELRYIFSDGTNLADDFVTGNTRVYRSIGIYGPVPLTVYSVYV